MKKNKSITLLAVILLLALSACSGKNASTIGDTSTSEREPGQGSMDEAIEMDEADRLIFGTILLDETENKVTTEQAESMLPLWQLYQTMVEEDTTASEELDAILRQIKAAFTDVQIAMMETFDYSNQEELMAKLGMESYSMGMDEGSISEEIEKMITEGIESGELQEGGSISGFSSSGGEIIIEGFEGDHPEGAGGTFNPEDLIGPEGEMQGGFGSIQTVVYIPAIIEYLEAIIEA